MANSTIIYACTQDGLGVLNKPGTLPQWLPARVALEGQEVVSAWGEPGPPIRVMVVTRDGELLLSENGGRTWSPVPMMHSCSAVFEMGDPPRPFVVLQNGSLVTTDDGGSTWTAFSGEPDDAKPLAGARVVTNGSHIYLLAERQGETWLLHGKIEASNNVAWDVLPIRGVRAVAYDAETNHLYVSSADGVHSSADGGDTWVLMPGSPQSGEAILAIPGTRGGAPAILVGAAAGLFLSSEGGPWQMQALPQSQAGAVPAMAGDPQRRDRLYAATAGGYIFESGNRGRSWQPVNAGPLAPVSYLYIMKI